jgi:nitrite reductase/ring-hydroxylating ferredoxin subunit
VNFAVAERNLVRAASVADVRAVGSLVAHVDGHTLALFADGDDIRAVDNRCPHMGFPLHRGTVKDGILTCHWHHARFDLCTGGTFDQWADDLRSFPVEVQDGEVWVDLSRRADVADHQRRRLRDGLERNLGLVLAKAAIALDDAGVDPTEPFRIGLEFGVENRAGGWSQGLTMHVCFANLLPWCGPEERRNALYHGLSAVAVDSAGEPPRFSVSPLPGDAVDPASLKRWFRRFVEVRDAEGAERCVVSALRAGAEPSQVADMLFAAATDHRYIRIGHVLDFTNKALEALDLVGWGLAEPVLASLASEYAEADRMEESNAWRHPVDLVAILERTFAELPDELPPGGAWNDRGALVEIVLGEDAEAVASAVLTAVREGASAEELAAAVAYAAALRIARFHTSNEFGDWDTALHTFTFANAVHQGSRRAPSRELLRGVLDAAMSVYLDRFLNVPPAKLAEPDGPAEPDDLLPLLDRQQRVNEAGGLVAAYLGEGGDPDRVIVVLVRALLREDRDFHTIQMVEAAVRQFGGLRGTSAGIDVLVAAGRYLAAHAPTVRAQGQTFQIAQRLHRGERLYEDA